MLILAVAIHADPELMMVSLPGDEATDEVEVCSVGTVRAVPLTVVIAPVLVAVVSANGAVK